METFFTDGDLQPLCNVLEPRFNVFSNRDYRWTSEVAVKTAFLMLLFDDRLYVVDSEPELKRRYADLSLIVRPDARKYPILDHLLEFKFIRLSDLKPDSAAVKAMSVDELKALPAVQGAFEDAAEQLKHYQTVLQQQYGEVLQLHCTAVVAVGFERLLWQQI